MIFLQFFETKIGIFARNNKLTLFLQLFFLKKRIFCLISSFSYFQPLIGIGPWFISGSYCKLGYALRLNPYDINYQVINAYACSKKKNYSWFISTVRIGQIGEQKTQRPEQRARDLREAALDLERLEL